MRERIVIETSAPRKAALVEQLDLQGETLTEWLEEQIAISAPDPVPSASDEVPAVTLADILLPDAVLASLRAVDWSFAAEDTRYLTHDVHPYPAKFPPQIPSTLIEALSLPGDTIFDPFGGSATTAVEAVRLRRAALSLDANPLSALMGRVKAGVLSEEEERSLEKLQAAVESYIANGEKRGGDWTAVLLGKHSAQIPAIPNIEKWFCDPAIAELALLRYLIDGATVDGSRDAALIALSRIVTRVSNQDSETRYVAAPKELPVCFTLKAYLESLRLIRRRIESARRHLSPTATRFIVGDAREAIADNVASASVDLIVTSPPYPNATDYHLYHRFRLFWLGYDPRDLGKVEIGSHLKHQRNGSGFEEYRDDMKRVVRECYRVLQPGRYAAFVVGDAVFGAEQFSTSAAIAQMAGEVGFELVGIIDRPIHDTKRSFAKPGRRARLEQVVLLQRPNVPVSVRVESPKYKMWPYEANLRKLEIKKLTNKELDIDDASSDIQLSLAQPALWNLRRAAFSTGYSIADKSHLPTWQKTLENGGGDAATRKDPKYATHGIHPYKGKFYPQLAKTLLNLTGCPMGSVVLDPYCGSGTVLLEGMLNGFRAYGADMNPLAAKIAAAKSGILLSNHMVVEHAVESLQAAIHSAKKFPSDLSQFPLTTHLELESWFAEPVIHKLNWLLGQIRLFGDPMLVDFLEVIVSSIVRDVSQQEPTDLRIRRRKEALQDAPVLELFSARLALQLQRLRKYWSVEARQPGARFSPVVGEGDSRDPATFSAMGLKNASVDCVVTSPPYATALPYIDTDRLSILSILGISSQERTLVEEALTGSREIRRREKGAFEDALEADTAYDELPKPVVASLRAILAANRSESVGFRRDNMAALLWRYFKDMKATLAQVERLLRPGGMAFFVVGDSKTKAGSEWASIETCRHTREIAEMVGFNVQPSIAIDVTTERLVHMKNAITVNEILIFQKPG